jgi:hypothetical protein
MWMVPEQFYRGSPFSTDEPAIDLSMLQDPQSKCPPVRVASTLKLAKSAERGTTTSRGLNRSVKSRLPIRHALVLRRWLNL